MKLLDLFCGAGGCSVGYHDAGFEVVGVDIKPQPHYPFEFYQADALAFCTAHGHKFDAIHASPPCQAYSGMRQITISRYGSAPEHPDLIAETRHALEATGKEWVIENVQHSPLRTQVILCGAAMGLPGLARHRHFESSILLPSPPACCHRQQAQTIGIYGEKPDGRRVSYRHHRLTRIASSLAEAQELMQVDWMNWQELRNAIPPAYTRWVGEQLKAYLLAQEAL